MVMNGYELKLLAYSLTKPKPPPHPVPNTTRFKLKSILTELNSGKTDGSAINSSISQGSQTYSAKQYMKELNRARQRKTFNVGNQRQDVNQLEQSITPITCQQADQDQTGPWGALAASIRARVHSVIQVQGYLREFYPPYIFKMKSRHLRQAKMATLNKGVSKLLCTAGCKEKWTETGNDTRVLFAVGDGNFGSTKGPVLHQQFISFLKKASGRTEPCHFKGARVSYIARVLSMRKHRRASRTITSLQPATRKGIETTMLATIWHVHHCRRSFAMNGPEN
ncbi:hypothetical protein BGX21_004089 [Mortierella sp. AD011]|nr:hypothetical protein BGX21_004089 [Mortierella sp. AD011]